MPLTPNGRNGYTKSNQPRVYKALLTQLSTDNPTATVTQNTLGKPITWTYGESDGFYIGTALDTFGDDETKIIIYTSTGEAGNKFIYGQYYDKDTIYIQSLDSAGANQNGAMIKTPISIEIH